MQNAVGQCGPHGPAMNAQAFIVIEQVKSDGEAVPVELAREQMRAAIDLFVQQALQFHATPAPEPGVIDLNYEPALHAALKTTTGGGKSEQMRQGAARFVLEQKRRGHQLHRVMFLVPTHRLADEASSKMLALFGVHGISTAIYQSREAKDLKTGEPLCRNLEAVKAAQSVGADVHRTSCKKGKVKCRFFDDCAFQLQREKAKGADVVFAAHELMFVTLNRFGKDSFGMVIIDEGFSLKGILQDPRQTRMKIDGISDDDLTTYPVRKQRQAISKEDTKELSDISKKLQSTLMQMPEGRLTRQALIDAGDVNITYGAAAKLEYKRMVKIELRPDTDADERRELVEQYKYMRQIRRRHRMWKALEEFLNGHEKIAGRLIIETATEGGVAARFLRVLGKKEIHETFTALPLLHGDATMELELVRHHLPHIMMLQEINVLAPNESITQIVGLAVGKKILALPASDKDPKYPKQQARRDRLRALVTHLARGRRTLVISQKDVEAVFAGIPNVATAHYGAIEGLDKYGNVEVLITIGRPMPSPSSIEMSGSALTGKAVTVGERKKEVRLIRLKDGTERPLHCNGYDNGDANLLCRAIAEGGVLQALGRSRAVNRKPENPVEAFVVLDDLTLPIPIDAVARVADVEPNEIDEMIARGLVPEWPADAAKLYPDLFKNRKAADYRYRRDGRVPAMFAAAAYSENGRTSPAGSYSVFGRTSARGEPNDAINRYSYRAFGLTSILCHFKPSGRGQRARRALLSAEVAPEARARIEAPLGTLAFFEVVGDPADDARGDERAAGIS
jgi:hypothetical protein